MAPTDAALFQMAQKLRRHSLESTAEAGSGHPTSCMSAADLLSVLFFSEMRYDPRDPSGHDADVFVLLRVFGIGAGAELLLEKVNGYRRQDRLAGAGDAGAEERGAAAGRPGAELGRVEQPLAAASLDAAEKVHLLEGVVGPAEPVDDLFVLLALVAEADPFDVVPDGVDGGAALSATGKLSTKGLGDLREWKDNGKKKKMEGQVSLTGINST